VSAEDLLARLTKVRATSVGRWVACCPAHDDNRPSLNITETRDGTTLIRCHAGCSYQDICDAAGVPVSVLFPPRLTHHRAPERRPFDAMQVLLGIADEVLTVAIISETLHQREDISEIVRDRLGIACGRIQRALSAVGELPEPPELKRLRRGEYTPPEAA
jgi:hypothetical protein